MPIFDARITTELEQFSLNLVKDKSLIGLDVGKKTLGMAVSYPPFIAALPLTTIKRQKLLPDIKQLLTIIDERDGQALIVGMPFTMQGQQGRSAQSIKSFIINLLKARQLPILLWDERWSSKVVERMMVAATMPVKHRAANVDKLAAAYILQGGIDRLRKQVN